MISLMLAFGGWIELTSMTDDQELRSFHEMPARLHRGESSCLAIARHRNWLLLTDDRNARQEAMRQGIRVSGSIGCLVLAVDHDIYSDASALLEVFGRRYPAPGKGRLPVMRWRQGLAYGQVKKVYKGGRVDRVAVRAAHGTACLEHGLYLLGYKQINTSVVERPNGTSRLRHQRQVRKTLAFSKAYRYHRWMRWLSVGLDNFCRAHHGLRIKEADRVIHRSPSMAAGLTDHIWTIREWLLTPAFGGQR